MARKYYLENCANKGSRLLGFMGILAVSFFATSSSAQAQSVGISNATITPSGSSMLEVRSTGKGVLIPRMSRLNVLPSIRLLQLLPQLMREVSWCFNILQHLVSLRVTIFGMVLFGLDCWMLDRQMDGC
jgi:hypothetical protein